MSTGEHDGGPREGDAEDEGGRPATEQDELVGLLVAGKYRVQRLVARGGMGRIYLAEQHPLGRSVALKVLDSRYVQSDQDPGFQKRFQLEAATCARLTHPNTVRIFDYGRLEGVGADTYYMVMEFLEGRTLRQVLRQEGPLVPARAVQILREVARSLREAHRHGVVHRDLKPSNVMLVASDEGEAVKVLDFGIAKLVRDDTEDLTMGGKFIGSPRYMAPEQIRHGQIDGRTDLYALGVLLFEILTGGVPFRGERAVQTLVMQLNDPVPPLRLRTGPPPPDLEALVLCCLAKKPEERYADMDALIAAIDALGPLPGVPGASLASRSSLQTSAQIRRLEPTPPPAVLHADPTPAPMSLRSQASVEEDSDVSPAHGETSVTGVLDRPARKRSYHLPLLLGAVAVLVLLILLARPWAPGDKASGVAPAPLPPSEAASVAPESAAPTREVAAPPSIEAVGAAGEAPKPAPVLRLEITPAGAEVFDGDERLGRTPLVLPFDDGRFAAGPRKLVVRLGGHRPMTVDAEPAAEDVVVRRALQPLPPRPVGGPPSAPKPPRPPDDMEIRTTR